MMRRVLVRTAINIGIFTINLARKGCISRKMHVYPLHVIRIIGKIEFPGWAEEISIEKRGMAWSMGR